MGTEETEMTKTIRHIVMNQGYDTLREAYAIAKNLCSSLSLSRITILCNVLKGPTEGIMSVITDRATAKQLVKGNTVSTKDGMILELRSERTFKEYQEYDVIFGIYLGRKAIEKMDTATSVRGVVFIPWLKDEATDWIQRWNPTLH
jgi:hypothetical protein